MTSIKNMLATRSVALILLWLYTTQAQVLQMGQCPSDVKTKEDFNATLYLGRWYEYSRSPFIFEINSKCNYAQYDLLPNGKISIKNGEIKTTNNSPMEITGTAAIKGPAKLAVSFPATEAFLGSANYWILDTDYVGYAVVYSCTEILGITHSTNIWILTRDRLPSREAVKTAEDVLVSNSLPLHWMDPTEQKDCPKQ